MLHCNHCHCEFKGWYDNDDNDDSNNDDEDSNNDDIQLYISTIQILTIQREWYIVSIIFLLLGQLWWFVLASVANTSTMIDYDFYGVRYDDMTMTMMMMMMMMITMLIKYDFMTDLHCGIYYHLTSHTNTIIIMFRFGQKSSVAELSGFASY